MNGSGFHPVNATWTAKNAHAARGAMTEGGFGWHPLVLDRHGLSRITKSRWQLWVRLENDQLVCVRAKS